MEKSDILENIQISHVDKWERSSEKGKICENMDYISYIATEHRGGVEKEKKKTLQETSEHQHWQCSFSLSSQNNRPTQPLQAMPL